MRELSRRLLVALVIMCAIPSPTVRADDPRPEIMLAPLDDDPLPPQARGGTENYLAKCLANPDDAVSCTIARTAGTDGGLESAVTGQLATGAYVACTAAGGVCLELATLDLGAGSDTVAAGDRLASVDITIAFAYDSAGVLASEAGKLNQLAAALRHDANKDARFAIIGHTDAKGGDAYNCRLSRQRADAVAARLGELAVEPARLLTIGAGEHVHRNDADGEAAENRRVGFARIESDTEPMLRRLAALCRG